MQSKIELEVKDAEKQDKFLLLDKNVSFEFKEIEERKEVTFSVNGQGLYYWYGELTNLINEIDKQIHEIILNEENAKK